MRYYIYIVYNKSHDKIYVGQTKNLKERLRLHERKEFKKEFTARFDGEWRLIYSEKAENRSQILKREK